MKDLLSAVRHSVKDEALLSSPDNQLICEINRHIDRLFKDQFSQELLSNEYIRHQACFLRPFCKLEYMLYATSHFRAQAVSIQEALLFLESV